MFSLPTWRLCLLLTIFHVITVLVLYFLHNKSLLLSLQLWLRQSILKMTPCLELSAKLSSLSIPHPPSQLSVPALLPLLQLSIKLSLKLIKFTLKHFISNDTFNFPTLLQILPKTSRLNPLSVGFCLFCFSYKEPNVPPSTLPQANISPHGELVTQEINRVITAVFKYRNGHYCKWRMLSCIWQLK